jgi:hypothetical protein
LGKYQRLDTPLTYLVTPSLANIFRAVADAIKADAAARMDNDDPMDGVTRMNGLGAF